MPRGLKKHRPEWNPENLLAELEKNPTETVATICRRLGGHPGIVRQWRVDDPAWAARYVEVVRARGLCVSPQGYNAKRGSRNHESKRYADGSYDLFLEEFAKCGRVVPACNAAGLTPSGVYSKIRPDLATYDAAFAERFMNVEANRVFRVEDNFLDAAELDGDTWVMSKILEARHPHYKREQTIRHEKLGNAKPDVLVLQVQIAERSRSLFGESSVLTLPASSVREVRDGTPEAGADA